MPGAPQREWGRDVVPGLAFAGLCCAVVRSRRKRLEGFSTKLERKIGVEATIREKEAAKLLGISVSTLRRWRRVGSGPLYRKLNGAVRYTALDLQSFVDARVRVSTRTAA